MTIAVIIPVLNEARLIGQTLSHTVDLGFDEVIVVDGGSSDQTCAIVWSFSFPLRLALKESADGRLLVELRVREVLGELQERDGAIGVSDGDELAAAGLRRGRRVGRIVDGLHYQVLTHCQHDGFASTC